MSGVCWEWCKIWLLHSVIRHPYLSGNVYAYDNIYVYICISLYLHQKNVIWTILIIRTDTVKLSCNTITLCHHSKTNVLLVNLFTHFFITQLYYLSQLLHNWSQNPYFPCAWIMEGRGGGMALIHAVMTHQQQFVSNHILHGWCCAKYENNTKKCLERCSQAPYSMLFTYFVQLLKCKIWE